MCNLEKIFMSWILAWGIHGSYTSVYPFTRKGKGVLSGSVDLFPAVSSVSPHYPFDSKHTFPPIRFISRNCYAMNRPMNPMNHSEWNLH